MKKLLTTLILLFLANILLASGYKLEIVSAFCDVSEYGKIVDSTSSELEKFFSEKKSYAIEGEKFDMQGVNFSCLINKGELSGASAVQGFSKLGEPDIKDEKLNTKMDSAIKEIGDVGIRVKAYLFRNELACCYLDFHYNTLDGFFECDKDKDLGNIFPVQRQMVFKSTILFKNFGEYTIFKTEIVNPELEKHAKVLEVFALKITQSKTE